MRRSTINGLAGALSDLHLDGNGWKGGGVSPISIEKEVQLLLPFHLRAGDDALTPIHARGPHSGPVTSSGRVAKNRSARVVEKRFEILGK